MDEEETGGAEPVDLRCGGEDATREERDPPGGGALANGHGEEESEPGGVMPVISPGTSYWSITESQDLPFLLSPAPGPSGRKARVQRASRPGLSRIPGRDHRRYYHEYWRCEYLMDFDPQRHGMICMVCGSSLATLKLSTIKRHIRQKHPDSLLWSAADKEVIRSGWESHLGLEGGRGSYGTEDGPSHLGVEGGRREDGPSHLDPLYLMTTQQPSCLSPHSEEGEAPQAEEQHQDLPGPSVQTLERYLNDSLHAWFRQEFLMEYEAEAGRLLCMVCGGELPSLHLDHIKRHVLDSHPESLVYSSEEKHYVLQAWAQTHDEPENRIKSEPDTKNDGTDLSPQDVGAMQLNTESPPGGDGTLTQDTFLISEDGGVVSPPEGLQPPRQQRKRRLLGGHPRRLRLDYLVAYGPQDRGTVCMVCSRVLHESKVSTFRRHIQEFHPETMTLSRQEREAMAAAWTKDYYAEGARMQDEVDLSRAEVLNIIGETVDVGSASKLVKTEETTGRVKDDKAAAPPSRHSHYPGKDQRRNYQVRWRVEYLMEYNCCRHGLICMVCGATLATLKVSTIKRHIQQVHPHSLDYSSEEKQQALLSYKQTTRHPTHSEDCLSPQDHGHVGT
ncbi:zinc finger translocation-associated protein [Brachionichthys hirsutus]|uniref:zinc finger translocation-associated protein n=1 Tax=Brachionichthys hirsutus TaxID=412623 RepID=UPI003604A923